MMATAALAPALRFDSTTRTAAGARADNQDRVLDRPQALMWAVADGMGGHADGGDAAQAVVDALGSIEHGPSGYAFLAAVEAAIAAANAQLFASARQTGTTLALLVMHDGHAAWLWAGDSRIYRLRDGELARLSADHSVVQMLVDEGAIEEGARHAHPKASVITRAVGAAAQLTLDRGFAPVLPGDRFLLCSDGLPLCLDDARIGALLARARLDDAADALLAAALERGAPDNVSMALVGATNA